MLDESNKYSVLHTQVEIYGAYCKAPHPSPPPTKGLVLHSVNNCDLYGATLGDTGSWTLVRQWKSGCVSYLQCDLRGWAMSNNSGLSAECWHTEDWDILLNRPYTSKSKPKQEGSPTPLEEPGSSRPCSSFCPLAGLLEEGTLPVLARILGESSHAVSNVPAFVLYWCYKKLVMDCSFWQMSLSPDCAEA